MYNLDLNFWLADGKPNIFKISQLKVKDFFENGRIRDLQYFNSTLNIGLPIATFFRLIGILTQLRTKYLNNLVPGDKSIDLPQFFSRFKRGSKQCRIIFSGADNSAVLRELSNAFSNVTDADTGIDNFKIVIQTWNFFSYPNTFREFLFKFYHNRLPVNSRLSHFTDSGKSCTFCNIISRGLGPVNDETFTHLFLHCPSTVKVHEEVERTLFELDPDQTKKRWLGTGTEDIFAKSFF
jgi:hypothetical protein